MFAPVTVDSLYAEVWLGFSNLVFDEVATETAEIVGASSKPALYCA